MISDYLHRAKSLLQSSYSLGLDYFRLPIHRRKAVRFNDRLEKLITQNPEMLPIVREPGSIAFNLARPTGYQLWIELTLAYLLAEAGHDTHLFYDDGLLSQWDDVQNHNLPTPHDGSYALTKMRWEFRRGWFRILRNRLILQNRFRAFQHARLTVHSYSEVVETDRLRNNSLSEGHERHAKSSAIRFFGTEALDFAAPEVQSFLERAQTNNRVSSVVGNAIVNKLRPDLFVTSHGIYSTWGGCYDVVSGAGVPSMVYAVHSTRPHHLWLFDTIAQDVASSPHWKDYKREPLIKREEKRIEEYMSSRIAKETPDNQVHFAGVGERGIPNDVRNFLSIDSDGLLFALFPNVPWDGNVEERNTIFEGVVDWITETIKQVAQTKHRLVIRFHPSETTLMAGAKLLAEIVRERVDVSESENVLTIASDEQVDTYRLLDFVDIGLVYDGTLASEMTYLGIPVIAAGRGRYSQEDWAFMPSSQAEYAHWITNPTPILTDFDRTEERRWEMCKRFVHWINFESSYGFPLLHHDPPIHFGGSGDLKPGHIADARMRNVLQRLQAEMKG